MLRLSAQTESPGKVGDTIVKFIISAIITLLMISCSSGDQKKDQQLSDSNSTQQSLLVDLAAEEIQPLINSYRGEKAVLINVWATWCGPCVQEFPHIVQLGEKYSDQLQVLFISADFDEDRDRALQFLKKQGVTYTTYFKSGKDQPFIEALSEDWSGALPYTKLITKDGTDVISWENSADFDTFETNIVKTINQHKL